MFIDVHGVTPGTESNANAPRNKICRPCATEVLLWGLKDWWIRERQKGFLEEGLMNRHDCPEGSSCTVHKDDLSMFFFLKKRRVGETDSIFSFHQGHARQCQDSFSFT